MRLKAKRRWHLSIWQMLTLGYLCVILIGTLLLMLPFATREGESTTLLNALFTSTSATCVTGLIAYDTATHWTLFGQIVIICLIQLGGLGFMTVVSAIFRLLHRDIGLFGSKMLMASTGGGNRAEMKRLFSHILLGTLLIEGLGAILLSIRFIPQLGVGRGIYFAVWHSISAFCNAGFDLMGGVHSADTFVSFTHSILKNEGTDLFRSRI
jgi:trk system potassium uptake protein TrkH